MVSNRSNGIYRSIFVALVGLILLAASNAPSQEPENSQGKQQIESAPVKATAPPKVPEPAYRPYADRAADACYNAQNHDSADLCAQWRAAIAAEKAANEAARATTWAIIATILSFVGVGGLIFTIWQTHGALGEARRGNRITMKSNARATRQSIASAKETTKALVIAETNAAAANTQVEIAQDTAKRQLRAYIKCNLSKKQEIGGVDQPIKIRLDVVNYGSTPAKNFEFQFAIGIYDMGWQWSGDLVTERARSASGIVHNGSDMIVEICSNFDLTRELSTAIANGQKTVFARGTFFYDDVFDEEHVTQVSLEIRDIEVKAGRVRVAPTGNIAS